VQIINMLGRRLGRRLDFLPSVFESCSPKSDAIGQVDAFPAMSKPDQLHHLMQRLPLAIVFVSNEANGSVREQSMQVSRTCSIRDAARNMNLFFASSSTMSSFEDLHDDSLFLFFPQETSREVCSVKGVCTLLRRLLVQAYSSELDKGGAQLAADRHASTDYTLLLCLRSLHNPQVHRI